MGGGKGERGGAFPPPRGERRSEKGLRKEKGEAQKRRQEEERGNFWLAEGRMEAACREGGRDLEREVPNCPLLQEVIPPLPPRDSLSCLGKRARGVGESTISFYLLLRKVYSFLGRSRGEVAPAGDCRTNHPSASLLHIKKVRGTRNFRWLEMPTAGNGNPPILEEEEKEESVHFSVFQLFFPVFFCCYSTDTKTQSIV